ncbi:MAG TPA: hydantoinase/oxoprolinase family protein [Steroidobacteraceae bacterium]|nr:hydantoinase/oxoprolinase family protein [Steroidobacteraceae bacterium]
MGAILRVAADVGGTFTDIACLSPEGELSTCKVLSTPADYACAVLDGIRLLTRNLRLDPKDFAEVSHASTVATNTILEAKGARTALVTTAGFRDVLELRRIRVPRLYEPLYEKPVPLVPRRRRYEVRERLDALGQAVVALDDTEVRELAATLAEAKVEAVAVSLLHAYANPVHEQRIAELLRAALPSCFVSVSSEVLPEIREYERTSTTVVNAYVGPVVSHYLRSLQERLAQDGIGARVVMMQSSGGTIDVRQVLERPAIVVESGPAAGVVGAARWAARARYDNVITFDMGGTTAKASLVDRGEIASTDEYEVGGGISMSGGLAKGGGYALKLPVIDVSEVGAGGGSIVRIDAGNALKVGPESAGALPGPVCYAKGGTLPTVTDANVVLGYLNPHGLAGGTVPIDCDLARAAIRKIADRLGLDLMDAAYGIHRLANTMMTRAVKAVSTYRGRDPRDFTLFAFGGNGGIHAASLAEELRIRQVLVPPAAGVFSAVGLLSADREATRCAAFLRPLEEASIAQAIERCALLEEQARADLGASENAVVRRRAALRYAGQGFELSIELPPSDSSGSGHLKDIRAALAREYRRTYGHELEGNRIEFVALRVIAAVPPPGVRTVAGSRSAPQRASREGSRNAYFGARYGLLDAPVIGREALDTVPRPGPLIIEEYGGTTVVPPRATALRDALGNIVLALAGDHAHAV